MNTQHKVLTVAFGELPSMVVLKSAAQNIRITEDTEEEGEGHHSEISNPVLINLSDTQQLITSSQGYNSSSEQNPFDQEHKSQEIEIHDQGLQSSDDSFKFLNLEKVFLEVPP